MWSLKFHAHYVQATRTCNNCPAYAGNYWCSIATMDSLYKMIDGICYPVPHDMCPARNLNPEDNHRLVYCGIGTWREAQTACEQLKGSLPTMHELMQYKLQRKPEDALELIWSNVLHPGGHSAWCYSDKDQHFYWRDCTTECRIYVMKEVDNG
jgi:hypothetical protein